MAVPEALAFDMYGTLVDPIRIWTRLEQYVPDQALRVSEVWRQKLLEYGFRLKRPGTGRGSEATGEWSSASTQEVPERVA